MEVAACGGLISRYPIESCYVQVFALVVEREGLEESLKKLDVVKGQELLLS